MKKGNALQPIKLAIVISSLGGGGAERQCVNFMKYLTRHYTFDIHVIIYNDRTDYLPDDARITLHRVQRKPGDFFRSIRQIRRLLRQIKPDIVHSYLPFPSMLTALSVSRHSWYVADFYRTVRPIKFPSKEWLSQQLVHRIANVVVSNTEAALQFHGKDRSPKTLFIHNGFDSSRIKPSESNSDEIRVVFLSRIDDPKDIPRYIELARKIRAIRPNVTFICAGDGSKREYYMQQSQDLLGNGIEFPGRIHDVESFLSACDIGILLNFSSGAAEGLSNSIMEYMAYGMPVIATNRGGTSELVIDGETGYLMGDDDDDLFEKTLRLIDQPELRKKLGQNGRDRILTEFSIKTMTESYLYRAYRLDDPR